jgi:hypothetical protein
LPAFTLKEPCAKVNDAARRQSTAVHTFLEIIILITSFGCENFSVGFIFIISK